MKGYHIDERRLPVAPIVAVRLSTCEQLPSCLWPTVERLLVPSGLLEVQQPPFGATAEHLEVFWDSSIPVLGVESPPTGQLVLRATAKL